MHHLWSKKVGYVQHFWQDSDSLNSTYRSYANGLMAEMSGIYFGEYSKETYNSKEAAEQWIKNLCANTGDYNIVEMCERNEIGTVVQQ